MLSRPDGTLVLVDSYSRLVDVTTDINIGVELSVVCESFVVADHKTLSYSHFGKIFPKSYQLHCLRQCLSH